jgi:integrase/recombinase XerD
VNALPVPLATPQNAPSQASQAGYAVIAGDFLAGLSRATRKAYEGDLRDFSIYCGQQRVLPLEAARRDIERYVRVLLEQRRLHPATVARRLSALSGLFGYAVDEGMLDRSPMTRVRRPAVSRDSSKLGLNREEAARLLAAARGRDARSYALISLLLLQGLRVSEVTGADASGLRSGQGRVVLVVTRKGGRQQLVPLAGTVADALGTYLDGRRIGPLLLSRTGRRLDRSAAARLVKVVAAHALPGRGDISPHTCRHAWVSLGLQAGVRLSEMSLAAAHRDVRTTMIYDTAQRSLEDHPSYVVADYISGATLP